MSRCRLCTFWVFWRQGGCKTAFWLSIELHQEPCKLACLTGTCLDIDHWVGGEEQAAVFPLMLQVSEEAR